jgi:hypothetical protein
MKGAPVFNLNGTCETIENGLDLIKTIKPNALVSCSGKSLPFPPDLDDTPLRSYIGSYSSISVEKGIGHTFQAFQTLKSYGLCPSLPD